MIGYGTRAIIAITSYWYTQPLNYFDFSSLYVYLYEYHRFIPVWLYNRRCTVSTHYN